MKKCCNLKLNHLNHYHLFSKSSNITHWAFEEFSLLIHVYIANNNKPHKTFLTYLCATCTVKVRPFLRRGKLLLCSNSCSVAAHEEQLPADMSHHADKLDQLQSHGDHHGLAEVVDRPDHLVVASEQVLHQFALIL